MDDLFHLVEDRLAQMFDAVLSSSGATIPSLRVGSVLEDWSGRRHST
jgi:hypothetical protein